MSGIVKEDICTLKIPIAWSAAMGTAVISAATPMTQALIAQAIGELHHGRLIPQLTTGAVDASRAWGYAAIVLAMVCLRGCLQVFASWRWAMATATLGEVRTGVLRAVLASSPTTGRGEAVVPAFERWLDSHLARQRLWAEFPALVLATLVLISWCSPFLGVVTLVIWCLALWMCRHAYDQQRTTADDSVEFQHGWRNFLRDETFGARSVRGLRVGAARREALTQLVTTWAAARLQQRQAQETSALPLHVLLAAGQALIALVGTLMVVRAELDLAGFIMALILSTSVAVRLEQVPALLVPIVAGQRAELGLAYQPADVTSHASATERSHSESVATPTLQLVSGDSVNHRDGPVVFSVRPGELVALVGRTGDGKETLAAAWSGRVTMQELYSRWGAECMGWSTVAEHDATTRARVVQTVGRDSRLLAGSIADNLRLGRPDLSDQELHRALVLAGVDAVVADFPNGIRQDPGELGVRLSGGQRQRLCLARAFAARPRFLCLNEATSELDPDHEGRVLRGLRALADDSSHPLGVLLLTASPLLLAGCDRILVVERGRVVAEGTDAELRKHGLLYARLLGQDIHVAPTADTLTAVGA
jgi:ABC-type transport system involved in cytochrome bd biosynthesis fused ATPase/permease subunit